MFMKERKKPNTIYLMVAYESHREITHIIRMFMLEISCNVMYM
jgi:hypothetical protein